MLRLAIEFLLLRIGRISNCLMSGGHIFGFQTHVSPALLRRNQFLHVQQVVRSGEQAKQPVDSRPAT